MIEYEILFIMKAGLSEDRYNELIESFQGWVTKNEGSIMAMKPWGMKDLPETFQKYTKGYYVESQFKGTPKTLDALKKNISVTEDIIRQMVVRLDSVVNVSKKALKEKVVAAE